MHYNRVERPARCKDTILYSTLDLEDNTKMVKIRCDEIPTRYWALNNRAWEASVSTGYPRNLDQATNEGSIRINYLEFGYRGQTECLIPASYYTPAAVENEWGEVCP